MAPSNDYLTEGSVQDRLARHHNRLIKMTMTQFPGEDPETHWDFNRPVENQLLAGFLERFAEPDFADGKVTIRNAAEHVYGEDVDEYLIARVSGMLQPASTFNKNHAVDGLVYVIGPDGMVLRDNRVSLARRIFDARMDVAQQRSVRIAENQKRGVDVAVKKANRINPDGKADLAALRNERTAEIAQQVRLALESGE